MVGRYGYRHILGRIDRMARGQTPTGEFIIFSQAVGYISSELGWVSQGENRAADTEQPNTVEQFLEIHRNVEDQTPVQS